VAGGVIGAAIGAMLFRLLESLGQIDTVINILTCCSSARSAR
jgi:hypothetical protein